MPRSAMMPVASLEDASKRDDARRMFEALLKKSQVTQFRRDITFMDYDPRRMDVVRVSKNDQGMFSQCREIALKLADELGKPGLPQE